MSARTRRGLVVVACAALLQACATGAPVRSAPRLAAGSELAALRARDRNSTSLQTAAVMEYRGSGGRFKAREQLTVRRPSSLRVEALTPLGVALVAVVNGDRLAIFDPGKNTLTRGVADAAALERVARIPLAPQQAVRLLLGLPPDASILDATPDAVAPEADMTVMRFARNDEIDELDFTGTNLTTVRRSSREGATDYEVHFSDYRDIGSLVFPHMITADFPAAATELTLTYQSPLVDSAIPDSAFVLQPGTNTKELELDAEMPDGSAS